MKHWLVLVALLLATEAALAQSGQRMAMPYLIGCDHEFAVDKDLAGPFDYRTQRRHLGVVEGHHFNNTVENAAGGQSTSLGPGPDLHYVLRKFPNHHRALLALLKFANKIKLPKDPQMPQSFSCYFRYAVAFKPNDTIARVVYALYLGAHESRAEAQKQLEIASAQANDSPATHYNIGLAYADLGLLDEALVSGRQAFRLGHPGVGLADRLAAAGRAELRDEMQAQAAPSVKASEAASAIH